MKKFLILALLTMAAVTVFTSGASAKTRPTPIMQPDPPPSQPVDPIQTSR